MKKTYPTQTGLLPPLPASSTDDDLLRQVINVHSVTYIPRLDVTLAKSIDLYEWWALWNDIYFHNTLTPLFITEGNTDYGKYLGFCQYYPERKILIQQQSVKTEKGGKFCAHHGNSVKRHPRFESLTAEQYNIALLLLHEMIHQTCYEADVEPGHNSPAWADWCNLIGSDLGMTLTFSEMKSAKETVILPDGSKTRVSIMVPVDHAKLLPNTTRFAEYSEQCRFPWQLDSPFITANTKTLTEGKQVAKNGGEPVELLPQF